MIPPVPCVGGTVPAETPKIEIYARDVEFPDVLYKADGTISADGVFTFEYPLVALDASYPCPDTDLREIEFSHLSLLGDLDPPVRVVGVLKEFSGFWVDGNGEQSTKTMSFTDFSDANGYCEDDRRAIDALAIGGAWISSGIEGHRVVRGENGESFEHSAGFLHTTLQ